MMQMELLQQGSFAQNIEMVQKFGKRFPGFRVLANMPETLEMALDMINHLPDRGRAILTVTGLPGAGKNTVLESIDALTRENPVTLRPFINDDAYHYLMDYRKILRRMHFSFSTTAKAAKLPRHRFGNYGFYPQRSEYLIAPDSEPGKYSRLEYKILSQLGGAYAINFNAIPYSVEQPIIGTFQSSSWAVNIKDGNIPVDLGFEEPYEYFLRVQNQIFGNDRWVSVPLFLANYLPTKRDTFTLAIIRDAKLSSHMLESRAVLASPSKGGALRRLADTNHTVRFDSSAHHRHYKPTEQLSAPAADKVEQFMPNSMMPVKGAERVESNLRAILHLPLDGTPITQDDQLRYYEYMLGVAHINSNMGYGDPYGVIEVNPYSGEKPVDRFMRMYEDDIIAKEYGLF